MACASSEDWDQPAHAPNLIRVFAVCMKKAWILSYPLSAHWRLWSDWADAQADLSHCWAHRYFVCFVMRRLNMFLWRTVENYPLTINKYLPCLCYWSESPWLSPKWQRCIGMTEHKQFKRNIIIGHQSKSKGNVLSSPHFNSGLGHLEEQVSWVSYHTFIIIKSPLKICLISPRFQSTAHGMYVWVPIGTHENHLTEAIFYEFPHHMSKAFLMCVYNILVWRF